MLCRYNACSSIIIPCRPFFENRAGRGKGGRFYDGKLTIFSGLQVGGTGEAEDEFGPHALRADYVDVFPMGLNDFFYDAQAQAGSALVFAAG